MEFPGEPPLKSMVPAVMVACAGAASANSNAMKPAHHKRRRERKGFSRCVHGRRVVGGMVVLPFRNNSCQRFMDKGWQPI